MISNQWNLNIHFWRLEINWECTSLQKLAYTSITSRSRLAYYSSNFKTKFWSEWWNWFSCNDSACPAGTWCVAARVLLRRSRHRGSWRRECVYLLCTCGLVASEFAIDWDSMDTCCSCFSLALQYAWVFRLSASGLTDQTSVSCKKFVRRGLL